MSDELLNASGVYYGCAEAARYCQVAPRTVMKWFDHGHIKGMLCPLLGDRRIPHEELVDFLTRFGMDVPDALIETGKRRAAERLENPEEAVNE